VSSGSLTLAIVGHLVGDYLLQNDWMALHKKASSLRCAIHCALWTLAVCAFAGWWVWWVPLVLFTTHFAQDRTNVVAWWMDAVGQRAFRTGVCAPWSTIVVDNVWHIVVLALVSIALGGAA
jgi:hypothetical protein